MNGSASSTANESRDGWPGGHPSICHSPPICVADNAVAWTAAFSFGLSIVLAALALVFALELAHAKWWLVVRRPLLACAAVTPLYVVLFVPVALLLPRIYPWASASRRAALDPEVAARVAHQMTWNHTSVFLTRAVLYLAVFCVLSTAIRRAHARGLGHGADARL